MDHATPTTYTAFVETRRLICGPLHEVAAAVLRAQQTQPDTHPLVLNDATGQTVDLDLRGGEDGLQHATPWWCRPNLPKDVAGPNSVS